MTVQTRKTLRILRSTAPFGLGPESWEVFERQPCIVPGCRDDEGMCWRNMVGRYDSEAEAREAHADADLEPWLPDESGRYL